MIENDQDYPDGVIVSLAEFSNRKFKGVSENLIYHSLKTADDKEFKPVLIKKDEIRRTFIYFFYAMISLTMILLLYRLEPVRMRDAFNFLFLPDKWQTRPIEWKIEPGDARLRALEPLLITVNTHKSYEYPKTISYRFGDNDVWSENTFGSNGTFLFPSVMKSFEYKILGNYAHSKTYRVDVIQPIYIKNIDIIVLYPEYTGLGTKNNSPGTREIKGLEGSDVHLKLEANRPLKSSELKWGDNKIPMPVEGSYAEIDVKLLDVDEYHILLTALDGEVSEDVSYPVRVFQDAPPEIEVIEPATDITMSRKSLLRMIYYASDDYGLDNVFLYYKADLEKIFHKKFLAGFNEIKIGYRDSAQLLLTDLDLSRSMYMEYYLEVSDKNTVSKKGISSTPVMRVYFFDVEHKKLIDYHEKINDAIYELLSMAIQNQTAIKEVMLKTGNVSKNDMQKLKNNNSKVIEGSKSLSKYMEDLLEKMKYDPLTLYETQRDFEIGKENLDNLRDGRMNQTSQELDKADNSLNNPDEFRKNIDESNTSGEKIVKNLEKLAALSDDLLERQKLSDVMAKKEEAESAKLDLRKTLDKLKSNHSPEELKELQKKLNNLKKSIQEMFEGIQKLRKELPEDFVNSQSLKKAEASNVAEEMMNLEKMLNRGDIKDIIKAAENMLSSLEEMMANMNDALQQSHKNQSMPNELAEKMDNAEAELDRLINSEDNLKTNTKTLLDKNSLEYENWQKNELDKLGDKMNDVANSTDKLYKEDVLKSSSGYLQGLKNNFAGHLPSILLMKKNDPPGILNYKETINNAKNNFDALMNEVEPEVERQKDAVNRREMFLEGIKKIADNELSLLKNDSVTSVLSTQKSILDSTKNIFDTMPSEIPAIEKDALMTIMNSMSSIVDDIQKNNAVPEKTLQKTSESLQEMVERLSVRLNQLKQNVSQNDEFRDKLKSNNAKMSELFKGFSDINSKTMEDFMNEDDKKRLEALTNEQKDIHNRTGKLQKDIMTLSNQTQAVGPEITDNVRKAAVEMDNTERNLSVYKLQKGMASEENALYHLWQAKKGMKDRRERMSQNMPSMGQGMPQPLPGGGYMQYYQERMQTGRLSNQEGQIGSRTDFVPLPNPDDYKPPKEFREDVLDILKTKNYPSEYKKLIEKYFRNLSQ